jgi:oligopeptide transport system substrate-binding protein
MHSKVKSSFFLTLFAIVLSACGVTPSSSTSSQAPSSSETPTSSAPTSTAPSSQETVVVTFDAKGGSAVAPVTVNKNGSLAAPTAPTRSGFRFGGWFRGKPGLTWLEPSAQTFPLTVAANDKFYAYWEPLDSKAMTYSSAETYFSSLSIDTGARLNPMTYLYSHEDGIMGDMSTSLYSTEVDWDLAIEQGVADFVGDFSKIEDKEFSIDALDFSNILVGAKSFPKDIDGDDFTVDGKYDRLIAAQTGRSEWIFEMRDDIFFENGTQVDASVVEYSLKQFLDPIQANRRSTSYYQRPGTQDSGTPILNAEQYRFQVDADGNPAVVDFSTVGFDIIDQFTFKITTWKSISQSTAVGFGNIRLVEPTIYAASLTDGANSTYGTPANPFVSYGPYIIKSWSDNQRIVMNKNYEYVRRDLINYKSIAYEFTTGPVQNVQLFEAGQLSATGLLGADFVKYAENPGIKFSWSGYPQYMIVNYAPSRATSGAYEKSAITQDERFRQALFFAFDRDTYNGTIYTPNAPSVLPVPTNMKAYLEDPLAYSESPQHLANLAAFGIPSGTNGYLPDRAKQLFEAALADFKTANPSFTGPINLRMVALEGVLNVQLTTFVKNQLETTFNSPGVQDKLIVTVVTSPQAALDATLLNWDFDLNLVNLGFGSSTGIQWQYGSISFMVAAFFGSSFGVNLPFSTGVGGNRDFTLTKNSLERTFTIAPSSAILTVGDTTGIVVGDRVIGTDIPATATVKAILSPTSFEITSNVAAAAVAGTRDLVIGGRATITVGNTANLVVGQAVSGTGIPTGSRITAIVNATSMTISNPVTESGVTSVAINPSIDLRNDPTSFLNQATNIDLSATLDYLEEQGEDWIYEEDAAGDLVREGHSILYENLLARDGKAAGIYAESLLTLVSLMWNFDTPYDATRSAPFAGATQDVWSIVAAMEKVFYEEMPLIPTATLQSAIIYAANVEILWPEYSVTFGWGPTRLRFLNTDADFSEGLYNSFEVAFLATAA